MVGGDFVGAGPALLFGQLYFTQSWEALEAGVEHRVEPAPIDCRVVAGWFIGLGQPKNQTIVLFAHPKARRHINRQRHLPWDDVSRLGHIDIAPEWLHRHVEPCQPRHHTRPRPRTVNHRLTTNPPLRGLHCHYLTTHHLDGGGRCRANQLDTEAPGPIKVTHRHPVWITKTIIGTKRGPNNPVEIDVRHNGMDFTRFEQLGTHAESVLHGSGFTITLPVFFVGNQKKIAYLPQTTLTADFTLEVAQAFDAILRHTHIDFVRELMAHASGRAGGAPLDFGIELFEDDHIVTTTHRQMTCHRRTHDPCPNNDHTCMRAHSFTFVVC